MSFATFIGHGLAHQGMHLLGPAGKAIGYLTNYAAPIETPSLEQIIHLGMHGWLDDHTAGKLARIKGVQLAPEAGVSDQAFQDPNQQLQDLWNRVYFASQELPTVHEYLTIANRQLMPDTQVVAGLRRWGYYGDDVRKDFANLRYEIPSSSDLVRFSVRHVFEPDLIAYLGYNDEFRPILDLWHRFQGLNYPIFAGPFATQVATFEAQVGQPPGSFLASYLAAGLPDPTWAQAFWWSHWVLPSPTQGYLAWFRLNPLRNTRWDGPEMAGVNFSYDDLTLLLRANDYPPKYRAMLAAIARPIPGIRYARDFAKQKVYDEADLFSWTQRQGYSPQDGLDITRDIWTGARKADEAPVACRGCAAVEKAYETGIIDRPAMVEMFVNFGMDDGQAAARADLTDLSLQTRRAQEVVKSIRKQFLGGKIGATAAQQMLSTYGIVATRSVEYIDDWSLERETSSKEVAAQKAIKWTCQGILSVPDLVGRLTNLGYEQPDIAGMIAEAELCAQALAARAAAAAARQAAAQQRALIQAQKQAAMAIQSARRQLASHGSPSQLRKWFCEGHIGEPEVYGRLEFLGWPDIDIARLIGDCKGGPGGGKGGATGPGGTAIP